MTRVALLDDYQDIAMKSADWRRLPADAEVVPFHDHVGDLDALADRLADFEVIVAMRERTPFRRDLLSRLPQLKLLVTTGMRNASIDVAAARDQGVVVCGTGGVGAPTVDLTWGLILALVRQIPVEDRAIREGAWQVSVGPGLEGKTLGVIGLGNLGARVAMVGRAFGMEVLAWSQNLTAERAAEAGASLTSKEELLSRADVVTIHLVLSERSRGLIGATELALMKASAYLSKHVARPDRRRGGPDRLPARGANCRRRPRCLRLGAAAGGAPAARLRQQRRHAPHRLRHPRQLPALLRRRHRGHPCLPRRRAGPRSRRLRRPKGGGKPERRTA